MPRQNIKKYFNETVNLKIPDRMPVLPIALDQYMARLFNVTYRQYSTDGNVTAKVWNKAIERFDLDWAGIFIDDLLEFEPLGIEATDDINIPKAVNKHLPATEDVLEKFKLPDPGTDGRMNVNLKAQRLIRKRWGDKVLICSSVAAPFTSLTLAFGMVPVMTMIYDRPKFLLKSLKFFEKLTVTWSLALLNAGADIIWLGDCSASSRFISVDTYKKFALKSNANVISEIKKAGGKVIYHAAENKLKHLKCMTDVKSDVLTVAENVNMNKVKDEIGSRVCLMGNLDSIKLLDGTPKEIRNEINTLSAIAKKGGYIINMAEGLPVQVPIENLEALIYAIRTIIFAKNE